MHFIERQRYAIYDNTGTFLLWKNYPNSSLPKETGNVHIGSTSQPIQSIDHVEHRVWLKTGPVEYRVIVGGKDIGPFVFTLLNLPRRGAEIFIDGKYYKGVKTNHDAKTITAVQEKN